MLARARLRIERGGEGRALVRDHRDAPPVAFRRCGDEFYLVATAASPIGTDDVEVEVEIGAGAAAVIRSVGATIAYQSSAARLRYLVTVEPGAQLDWHLEPLIVTSRCALRVETSLALGAGSAVSWTEEVLLGRHGERPGALEHRFTAEHAGRPLLRHDLCLGAGAPGWDGPAVLGTARAVGVRLVAGHPVPAGSATSGPGWARMALEGPGYLDVALGADRDELRAALERAGRAVPAGASPAGASPAGGPAVP
ncbi:MAG: Urease accessory protein UreD [Acidimicrobiaceae bacterium]|nr:Urease accessory protein UreD [Acidimicrobiaceae bacterium]